MVAHLLHIHDLLATSNPDQDFHGFSQSLQADAGPPYLSEYKTTLYVRQPPFTVSFFFFSGKFLYGICLTLCRLVRQHLIPLFFYGELGKIPCFFYSIYPVVFCKVICKYIYRWHRPTPLFSCCVALCHLCIFNSCRESR